MQQPQVTIAPASVVLRIGAFLIDTILTSLISLPLLSAVGAENINDPSRPDQSTIAVLLVVNAIYTIGLNSTMSTTLGKLALGMYVSDVKGARIRPDTAILRYIVFLVGHTFFFGSLISFVMVLVNPAR